MSRRIPVVTVFLSALVALAALAIAGEPEKKPIQGPPAPPKTAYGPAEKIGIVVKFTARDAKAAEEHRAWLKDIGVLVKEKEPEVLEYKFYPSRDNPLETWVIEVYANQAAYDAHIKAPFMQPLWKTRREHPEWVVGRDLVWTNP